MGITGDMEKKAWSNYTTISAVTNNAIYSFDSYEICSPTPVSFVNTLNSLAEILSK